MQASAKELQAIIDEAWKILNSKKHLKLIIKTSPNKGDVFALNGFDKQNINQIRYDEITL